MNEYVVAYFNAHEGSLTQSKIKAESELQACAEFLGVKVDAWDEIDDMSQGGDFWISAFEL